MKTVKECIEEDIKKRKRLNSLDATDGVLANVVRILVRPVAVLDTVLFNPSVRVLAWLCTLPAKCCCCRRIKFFEQLSEECDAGIRWRMAMDLYRVGWFVVLVSLYWLAVSHAGGWYDSTWHLAENWWNGNWSRPFVVCGVVAVIIRGYESLSVVARVHSDFKYTSPALIRSMFNTMWLYLEFTLIFATLFVFTHVEWEDPFINIGEKCEKCCQAFTHDNEKNREFIKSPLTPLYFSFATITTLGYGDFSPKSDAGKWLVILEVLSGFILLIVVFQRAISKGQKKKRSPPHPGWKNL